MQGATILFRNFAGKEGKFNREGDRNFCVLLDDDTARQMEADGWNIKHLRPREEGDEPQAYLPVSVSYKIRPPRVVILTSKGRNTITDEDMIEVLDWVDVEFVDLTVRPYNWSVNGKDGIKAYLQTIYVKIHEDPLDLKYQDVEELPASNGRVVGELPAGEEHEVIEGSWK